METTDNLFHQCATHFDSEVLLKATQSQLFNDRKTYYNINCHSQSCIRKAFGGEKKKQLCIIFHIDSRVRSLAWLRLPLLYFPSQPVMQFVFSKILSEKIAEEGSCLSAKRKTERGGSYSRVGGVWTRRRMYQHELARPRIFH